METEEEKAWTDVSFLTPIVYRKEETEKTDDPEKTGGIIKRLKLDTDSHR